MHSPVFFKPVLHAEPSARSRDLVLNRRPPCFRVLTLLVIFLSQSAPAALAGGNAPVGGGGACNQSLASDGSVGQQQAYNNGLYTCLSGGTWTPEALIVGSVSQDGTALACSSTTAGGMRYNSSSGIVQVCDGTSWQSLFASTCDNAPALPVFADQTNLATSSLTSSNIVLVTGMDAACNATVGISGTGGSPQYRVCSDAACSTVTTNWTNANNSIAMQGKYIQLRATSSASVATSFAITLSIGSVSSIWNMSTGMSGCTPIGTVCSDGTVYAGLSGASTPMYVTRCDVGQTWNGSVCTGTRSTLCWNNCNTTGYVTTSTAATDGQTYTTTLIATDSDSVVGGTQQHQAAQYCADLSQDGHSDWYLPAQTELNTLYTNKTAIGNFDTVTGYWYWSSSEYANSYAWYQRFTDGNQNFYTKPNGGMVVRCARR